MTEIFVADHHAQIYDLWLRRGDMALSLSHIDFHCDMRGLLIDRKKGRACLIDRDQRRQPRVDSGNFLGHAIMAGIVSSVRWVHDAAAGRKYDPACVKFESDFSALPHRLSRRVVGQEAVAVEFEELELEEWDGPRVGEHLDIDWDGIASNRYEPSKVKRLAEMILDRDFRCRPPVVYLVFSAGYSHSDREPFESFLAALQRKLDAGVSRLPPLSSPDCRQTRSSPIKRLERSAILGLRRIGIY